MFGKKDNAKATYYANILIDEFKNRRSQYHLENDKDIKIRDEHLEYLYNKSLHIINKIIDNGNEFILTRDYLYYLTYISLKMIDYSNEALKLLNNLVDLDDKKVCKLYDKYFSDIMYNKYIKDLEPIDTYINRMEGDYKDAFIRLQTNTKSLSGIFVRGYEFDILDRISTLIFVYCVKNNILNQYGDLTYKYFKDPRDTIDYFVTNGFIDDHYDLIDTFDAYIYKDMLDGEKNACLIK